MADEGEKGSPGQLAAAFIVLLIILAMAWFVSGGPSRANLESLFLAPPSAPTVTIPQNGGSGVISQSASGTPSQY